MRVLLDTHTFLWLVTDDPTLSERARSIFLDSGNELLCSAVVGFEISVKFSLGKLELAEPPREFMENRMRKNAFTPLPVTLAHTYRLAHLPFHHRDPFDRLLVAQALEEDVPLLRGCRETKTLFLQIIVHQRDSRPARLSAASAKKNNRLVPRQPLSVDEILSDYGVARIW